MGKNKVQLPQDSTTNALAVHRLAKHKFEFILIGTPVFYVYRLFKLTIRNFGLLHDASVHVYNYTYVLAN